jgi:HTH-type transcriptional regulator, competence development regulator
MAGNVKFGKQIRELRETKKTVDPSFSLRQFAIKVGISATFLSKIETGEFDPPRPEFIIRMAELLEVDADELLALAGKTDPELDEIIKAEPRAMADLLRTARDRGLTAIDLERITKNMKRKS